MKKILASLLAITMLMTTMSACIIPASADDAVATGAFTEDFEDYGSGNWLANMTEDGELVDSTKIDGMEENEWTIYAGQDTTAWTVADAVAKNASIEVVADPTGADNQVLKLDAGDLGDKEFFSFRRNVNGTSGVKHTDLQGKKMVIKAKYYVPTSFNMTSDTAMLYYDRSNARPPRYYTANQHGANYSDRSWTILALDSRNYGSNLNVKTSASVPVDTWFDIKFVLNLSGDMTAENPADTYRGFLNDSIYTMNLPVLTSSMTGSKIKEMNSKFPQPSSVVGQAGEKIIDSTGGYTVAPTNSVFQTFGDFYGTSMSISGAAGSTTDYMYMDDLMVYFIDDFKQEGEAVIEKNVDGAWYKGTIRIPFTNDLMTVVKENGTQLDYKTLFTLKDASGNVVEGGIADAYADGKYLVITPAADIERLKSYTISASPLFMDAEGQGLNQYSKDQNICTFATAEDPFAHIIYDFDFEDAKIDGVNWIESRNNTTDRYVVADGVELGAVTINKHASLADGHAHSIKVVADPTGADNQVLELKAGYVNNGVTTQIRFNANGKTGLSRATDMGKGKNLVYKAKIFVPSDFAMTESSQLVNMEKEDQSKANTVSGIGATMSSGFYAATTGSWGSPMARNMFQLGAVGGQWVEWKHVADVSEALSATHSDTVRAYVGDRLVTTTFGKTNDASLGQVFGTSDKYTGLAIGDNAIDYLPARSTLFTKSTYETMGATWWGSHFTINPQTNTAKSDTFYIDDVEAFWIDDLTFDTVNAENFEGGKVKLNFNQKIREKVEYFDGTKVEKSNAYKTIALADLFKVVDLEGNVVEGGIAAVSLSADGKTVSITPSASLTKGADYQIEISPYLIDEYGQGLLNNSKATYVDLHISETFTPFEMLSISQTEISGFATGRDVKVTANFSVAVDNDSITNGVVVTKEDGTTVARDAGWSASYGTDEDGNTDYKVVVFDFGSLPTANYEVTLNENFVATNGAELSSAFGITINKANDKIVLFEEDFEDYATGNWITAANEVTDLYSGNPWTGSPYYKSYTFNDHDWDIQQHWSETAPASTESDDFAGIAEAPAAAATMSGNAFRIKSARGSTYGDNYVAFRRNFDKLNGIDFSSEEYKGKKLVYEADIYAAACGSDNSFFVPFAGSNPKAVRDYADWQMLFTGTVLRSAGAWQSSFASYGPIAMYSQAVPSGDIKKAPIKYTMVISMGEDVDTVAYYSNGQLVQRAEANQSILKGHEWNNSARHEFFRSGATNGTSFNANDILYGVWGLACKSTSDIYMDNFNAYLVDEFVVENVEGAGDVFNTAKGAVTYTFSKPVNPDKAVANDTIVLLDAEGNEVAGGIASVTLDDANYKLVVKLSDTLPGKTQYTIKLTEELADVDGLPLSTEWKWYQYPIDQFYTGTNNVYSVTDIAGTATLESTYTPATSTEPAKGPAKLSGANAANAVAVDTWVRDADAMKMFTVLTTSKATSLFAEADTATVSGSTVTTNVTFTNPEVEAKGVWCVVAAFGEYNEMLGCTPVSITTVEASSSTDAIPVTITTNGGTVKSVKMFVWNSYEDMKPYHKAESIYTAE